MKKLIEYKLTNGGSIFIEVEENEPTDRLQEGMVPATPITRGHELIEKAAMDFERALDTIKPAAATIIKKIRSLNDVPDEIDVQFGLKLTASAGAVVAAAGVDANYTVTLKWKKPEKKQI